MALTRRRFLTIASASCLMAGHASRGMAAPYRWRGAALGAKAQIVLDHPQAAQLADAARAEIARLERVFSLFDAGSDLSRLNAGGRLEAPSFEMLDCLALARRVHGVTEGRFDPTVQPLWQAMARAATGVGEAGELEAARNLIGFERLRFDTGAIVLGKGQALTLNGIAQGYIADRVAALLRREGITDVLIDTGELVAMGHAPGAAGWPVTIAGEAAARLYSGRALATSAPLGTQIAPGQGHILDPRSGVVARGAAQVSVSARSAAMADALSTALVLTQSRAEAAHLLSKVKEARLEAYRL